MRLPSLARLLVTAPLRPALARWREELVVARLWGWTGCAKRWDEAECEEEEADEADEAERAGDVERVEEAVDASAVVAVERT